MSYGILSKNAFVLGGYVLRGFVMGDSVPNPCTLVDLELACEEKKDHNDFYLATILNTKKFRTDRITIGNRFMNTKLPATMYRIEYKGFFLSHVAESIYVGP